ncbi:MAG TPA: hypothetical protein VKB29_12915 [Candidatus Binataceae bacterium]|nr:hypothetical protein [Candidatus Binataceae bacterium]
MMRASQKRAVANDRRRLKDRGMARYEVRGLETDKQLVRKLARRLAANDDDAQRLRAEVARQVASGEPRRGGIWAALRRSPLVGAGLNLEREIVRPRDVDL